MFSGGANVIMQNITPKIFADNYQIYPKKIVNIDILKDRSKLEKDINLLGRRPI